jgi:hypothetical protein
LFSRQTESAHIGEYVNLDFGDLVMLSRIDLQVREVFLVACIDVEHFAKVCILTASAAIGESKLRRGTSTPGACGVCG